MVEYEISCPGRLCLFGEHSDWAAGYNIYKGATIVAPTNQRIHAVCYPRNDSLFYMDSPILDRPFEIPLKLRELRAAARSGTLHSYVAGTAYKTLKEYGKKVSGIEIIVREQSNLPVKKGLSSSAAICVLTARAFNQCYSLDLSESHEMDLAYEGERLTGSKCGRMDQICALDRPAHMIFSAEGFEYHDLPVGTDMYLVVVDLKRGKDTKKILTALNDCYRNGVGKNEIIVQYILGQWNWETVKNARDYIESGDLLEVGRLMWSAQAEFDRHVAPRCPSELEAPRLHEVLEYRPIQPHILGGKGVGSQGDGSAQLLAKSKEDQRAVMEILERDRELDVKCFELDISKTIE